MRMGRMNAAKMVHPDISIRVEATSISNLPPKTMGSAISATKYAFAIGTAFGRTVQRNSPAIKLKPAITTLTPRENHGNGLTPMPNSLDQLYAVSSGMPMVSAMQSTRSHPETPRRLSEGRTWVGETEEGWGASSDLPQRGQKVEC